MLRILKEQSVADRQSTPKEDALRKEALDIFNLSSNRFDIFLKWLESRDQEHHGTVPDNLE